jgi:hypothetical protein
MQRSISTLLATLLLSAAFLPAAAQAQTTEAVPTSLNPYVAKPSAEQLSPFDLAYLGYQGYLKDQGVPEASALIDAIDSGKITAQDMIQAAVKANRLSEQMLSDQGYRHHLEAQLRGFTED